MEWVLAIVYAIGFLSTIVECYNSDESAIVFTRSRTAGVCFAAIVFLTAALWPAQRLVRMIATLLISGRNIDDGEEDEDLPPR